MIITPLHAFRDNFVFVLEVEESDGTAVVDPGEARPVLEFLSRTGRRLSAILVTHHHQDHVGGNRELLRRFPGIPVYASEADRGRIPGQTVFLTHGETFPLLGYTAHTLFVPGHTKGHVAYFVPGVRGGGDLFSGDTVFGATIGNLFEGTPSEMYASIRKIRDLPAETRIWCAHEYTLTYVREAAQREPRNAALQDRLRRVEQQVRDGRPTVPLLLSDELATNPFFRFDDPAVRGRCGTADDESTFVKLCEED